MKHYLKLSLLALSIISGSVFYADAREAVYADEREAVIEDNAAGTIIPSLAIGGLAGLTAGYLDHHKWLPVSWLLTIPFRIELVKALSSGLASGERDQMQGLARLADWIVYLCYIINHPPHCIFH